MSYNATDDDTAPMVAATFIDRESAHDALGELHRAGFRRVWLGVTRADTRQGDRPTVESEDAGSFMEALGRFFSGEEARGHALHEALVMHGLSEAQARRIDESISPGNAVVVADGEYDPAQAMKILRARGGELDTNASSVTPSMEPALDDAPRTVNRAQSEETYGEDRRRLNLREERLTIEKERVRSGEARVGKDVVTEQQSLDVPVFHEELYVERRPARRAAGDASPTAIGEGEEIRVPLTAERVDVSKHAVVTEEVVIGKRRVQETQNVSDTVRREELHIDETTADTARVADDAPLSDR